MTSKKLGNRTDVETIHNEQQTRSTPTNGLTKNNNNDTTGFGVLEGRESEFVNRRGGGVGGCGSGGGGRGGGGDDRCLSGGDGAGALASCHRRAARRPRA